MSQNKALTENDDRTPDWHATDVPSVLTILQTRQTGLTDDEVIIRQTTYGQNAVAHEPPAGIFTRLFRQLKSPLTLVLIGAFLVTFSLQEFVDSGVIALALFIAVIVGMIQEGKASRAFLKLVQSQEHIAFVERNGKRYQVNAIELVPGDVVSLQSGMQVPADIRLMTIKNFTVNEAPLTGEWLAVNKQIGAVSVGTALTDRTNMAYKGTFVASGTATGVVVATGSKTSIGALADELRTLEGGETPLQREVHKVSQYMLVFILVIISGLFVVGIMQGQSVHEMLLISIAIAVASVPEGLPAALTIILAVGMEALLKRGGLVRNLLAAETLGSTTFVLTDKTGTLTEGRMSITGLMQGDSKLTFTESWETEAITQDLIQTALYASDSFFDEKANVRRGDPEEVAVLQLAERCGVVDKGEDWQQQRIDYLPFSSEQRFAAGLVPYETSYRVCINGAPSTLLNAAFRYVTAAGEVAELTKDVQRSITSMIKEETSKGNRLIAVAYKDVLFQDLPPKGAGLMSNLVFAGILILSDPVRKDVKEAIAGVERAGARILLITGDNPQTALTIAQEVGITLKDPRAMTGKEMSQFSDKELLTAIDNGLSVFARVLPQQKLLITQLLQKRGEIVAMTGDGINDALALQKANIGVATGSGTEVAKEAADLVLVNDTFSTMYAAIEEGRRIVSNLKKIMGYLISTSLSEVVLIGAALLSGAPSPLSAVQILWANVIEEGFMSVAFAFEKGDDGLMKEKPQDVHKNGILAKDSIWFMLFCVLILGVLSLGLYFYLRSLGVPYEEIQSTMFLLVAVDSMFMAFAFRSLTQPIWKIPLRSNLFFLASLTFNAVLLVIVLSVPMLRSFLSYQPLPLSDIMLVIGVSIASLMTVEAGKWLFFQPHTK